MMASLDLQQYWVMNLSPGILES